MAIIEWPRQWPGRTQASLDAGSTLADTTHTSALASAAATSAPEFPLFGAPVIADTGKPEEIVEQPVVDTALPLRLVGIFRTNHTQHDKNDVLATALIAQEQGEAVRYRINDSLPGDATLVAVYPFYVMLRRQGQLEALRFIASPNNGPTTQPTGRRVATSTPTSSPSPANTLVTSPAAIMTNDQIRDALRQRALALQNVSATDPLTQ